MKNGPALFHPRNLLTARIDVVCPQTCGIVLFAGCMAVDPRILTGARLRRMGVPAYTERAGAYIVVSRNNLFFESCTK